MKQIPYGRQCVDEDDIQAVVEVLKSDWLTTGPALERFETALAERVGACHAVAFSSGTAALHAAYHAAGVSDGSEVITTPNTFAATANAAFFLGGKPVFADIDPDTLNIAPAQVAGKVTRRTKVIAPVDFAGCPAPLNELKEIAQGCGALLIEDASHALGATYQGQAVGSIADMTVFSFHPVKHITTGEGGAITTNDPVFHQRLRNFRNHGMVRDPDLMTKYDGSWYMEMQSLGFNYRLTDIQAVLGHSQLKKLDSFLSRRREIVAQYDEAFRAVTGIQRPDVSVLHDSAWHLYVIQVPESAHRTFFEALRSRGVGVQVHYIPVYLHPYYRYKGYASGLCPSAEAYYRSAISLPLYPAMTNEDVLYVIERVTAVWQSATEAT